MFIHEKIAEITGRLKAKMPDVSVKEVDDIKCFAPKTTSAVLVYFMGESFGKSEISGAVSQPGACNIGITVMTKNLSSKHATNSAYLLVDSVKKALTGYRVDGEKMILKSAKLVSADHGKFSYQLVFNLPAYNVEDLDDENFPLATNIKWKGKRIFEIPEVV